MLLFAASTFGCQALEAPPPPPQIINFRVFADPGKPVSDAFLLFQGKKIAKTTAAGVGQLKLAGRDGDSFDINVLCPQGYISPDKPVRVLLKRFTDRSISPEYSATCQPTLRSVVVAVRANNTDANTKVADMPVMYLGKEVARTDESGAAHVLLKLQPGEQFELTLDTSDKQFAFLRPQNPVASFSVGQRDEVFTFDQKFEERRPVIHYAPPRRPIKIVRR